MVFYLVINCLFYFQILNFWKFGDFDFLFPSMGGMGGFKGIYLHREFSVGKLLNILNFEMLESCQTISGRILLNPSTTGGRGGERGGDHNPARGGERGGKRGGGRHNPARGRAKKVARQGQGADGDGEDVLPGDYFG